MHKAREMKQNTIVVVRGDNRDGLFPLRILYLKMCIFYNNSLFRNTLSDAIFKLF